MSTQTAAFVTPSIPIPVLPPSAPFSPAQVAWLNGFFAGLLGGGGPASGTVVGATPAAAPAVPVEAEEFPWHDPAISLEERLKLADEKPHPRKLMAAMAQLDCGACGYNCQTYAEAIAAGKEKDLTRCAPGGRETSRALKQISAAAPPPADKPAAAPGGEKASAPTAGGAYDRNNPFPSRLVSSARLNARESSKDTRNVVLDLRGSGLKYKAGDALGVFPENCPEDVHELLAALGFSGAEDVPGWDGSPISLFEALLREFSISRPSPDLLDLLSRNATDKTESDALKAMQDDENGAGSMQLVDLVRQFPSARPSPGDFVSTLSPLAPRLYSISSSPLAHPEQVHLTVGVVRFDGHAGRRCKGVASTFLGERLRPGQKARVFVHASHKFGLPADGSRPVIMVGPGTGVAPFRAFLQEREAASATGKNWLFFGDQRRGHDFLYERELTRWQETGLLTRLDTAFSRDQQEKVYVQHRMLEHGAELWRWLQEQAVFYVCGDANRMALDVDKALREVITKHGGLSPADADKYVAEMVRAGRYQRDVY